jgi:hypothetical protein
VVERVIAAHSKKFLELPRFLLPIDYIFDKSKKLIFRLLFRQRSSDGRATDL